MAKKPKKGTKNLAALMVAGPPVAPPMPEVGPEQMPPEGIHRTVSQLPPVKRMKDVTHQRMGPNTILTHVKETVQPAGQTEPLERNVTHIRRQVGPGIFNQKTIEHTRPMRQATPNPNTRLRLSGNPNAFRFGRKPV